ncbi:MAG: hypothetical protein ACR2ND_10700 [Solirubrobacteraceae bacterium]
MKRQPLLSTRSAPMAATLTVLVPLVYGAICGAVLGQSKFGYSLLILLSLIGGFLGGMEHDDVLEGVWRGLLGGLLFGTGLLVTYEAIGDAATTKLPDPNSLIVVIAAIVGVVLGAAGASVRRRNPGP